MIRKKLTSSELGIQQALHPFISDLDSARNVLLLFESSVASLISYIVHKRLYIVRLQMDQNSPKEGSVCVFAVSPLIRDIVPEPWHSYGLLPYSRDT